MPEEAEVEKVVRRYLAERGFSVEERTRVHGVDIVAEKDGQVHFIEVQGNTGREGQIFENRQKRNHAYRVVGQVCARLHANPEAKLGIAFPEDEFYISAPLGSSLVRMDISEFTMPDDYSTLEQKYNWRWASDDTINGVRMLGPYGFFIVYAWASDWH